VIEKMKFVSATGPKDHFDDIVDRHLSKYDLHLENAFQEFSSENNITPFSGNNPYKEVLSDAEDLMNNISCDKVSEKLNLSVDEATHTIIT
jgi:V/A-type H+-transporting ATPase subunit I